MFLVGVAVIICLLLAILSFSSVWNKPTTDNSTVVGVLVTVLFLLLGNIIGVLGIVYKLGGM